VNGHLFIDCAASWGDGILREVDLQKLELAAARLGETVVDPTLWPDVLEAMCRAVGATGAFLLQSDVRTPDVPRTKSLDDVADAYFSGWHLNDTRAERAVPLLLGGTKVVVDQDIFTPEEINRMPFYNELIFPAGFHWFSVVGFRAGSALWGLSFQRTAQDGPLEDHGRRVLATLSQRLTEVSALSQSVGRIALSSVTNALNCVLQPALVIDRNGRVLDANPRANDMFDDDLRVHKHRLVVRDPFAQTLLDQLINRLRSISDLSECPLDPIAIRREGKQPVVLRTFPIHGAAREPFLGARALLTLTSIGAKEPAPPALLAQAFALTPAEARLAVIIAQGATTEHAAEALGISRATARNQLKSVFAKTGMHRQSELVALLSHI
jgi:DNA-binding CsgD family transcriptional regulator/PAS domain-containing protein